VLTKVARDAVVWAAVSEASVCGASGVLSAQDDASKSVGWAESRHSTFAGQVRESCRVHLRAQQAVKRPLRVACNVRYFLRGI
jgi:hypothetical protein